MPASQRALTLAAAAIGLLFWILAGDDIGPLRWAIVLILTAFASLVPPVRRVLASLIARLRNPSSRTVEWTGVIVGVVATAYLITTAVRARAGDDAAHGGRVELRRRRADVGSRAALVCSASIGRLFLTRFSSSAVRFTARSIFPGNGARARAGRVVRLADVDAACRDGGRIGRTALPHRHHAHRPRRRARPPRGVVGRRAHAVSRGLDHDVVASRHALHRPADRRCLASLARQTSLDVGADHRRTQRMGGDHSAPSTRSRTRFPSASRCSLRC